MFNYQFVIAVFSQLDKTSRTWMILAASSDYHPMAKMIQADPQLVTRKVRGQSVHAHNEIVGENHRCRRVITDCIGLLKVLRQVKHEANLDK